MNKNNERINNKEKGKVNNKEHNELNKLKEQIKKLEKEKKEAEDKSLYSSAELVNYRKRKDEEVSDMLKYANKDLITDLIPVIDNFERAIKLDDNNLTDELSKFLEGFKMMYSEMVNILNRYGVSAIDRKGEEFDPNLEQALMSDSLEDHKNEEVLEVLLKGYKLKDRVIRPATVKINKIEGNDK